jgi:hypothetical protein
VRRQHSALCCRVQVVPKVPSNRNKHKKTKEDILSCLKSWKK